ncbi:DUF2190 family protein [Delftia acidovorans]|uniref:DUF2190 family protein n=1 Tax=Delftia acidovorans TaxID=80866 RepID=A0AAJ2VDW5_DELAC|nr:DUF2190 family protein [Delftia acidovorans]MDX4958022.1 DUF2190 family protein [Delftia acidovorans]
MTDVLVVQEIEILAEEARDSVLVEQVEEIEILEVAEQGPPGRPGEPGPSGGASVQRTAGTNLSALLAVYELNGLVRALSADDGAHIDLLLGITLTAAQAGEPVNVQRLGAIEDPGWNWVPGRVYLGANGALTQTPPTSGFDVLIGSATSPTRIALNLQDPISLE